MKTTRFLALMALLVAGTAQAQAPQPDNRYFLTKVTLSLNNGVVPSPFLPPHVIGRFPGDKLTIELSSDSSAPSKTFQLANLVSGLQLPDSTEILTLKPAPNTQIHQAWNSLQYYKQTGLQLRIAYVGAVPTNAWQLKGASLQLEFRDKDNNLHPKDGIKTVKFNTNNVRVGFNVGDDPLSAAKHRDTVYLIAGANFSPLPIKLATN